MTKQHKKEQTKKQNSNKSMTNKIGGERKRGFTNMIKDILNCILRVCIKIRNGVRNMVDKFFPPTEEEMIEEEEEKGRQNKFERKKGKRNIKGIQKPMYSVKEEKSINRDYEKRRHNMKYKLDDKIVDGESSSINFANDNAIIVEMTYPSDSEANMTIIGVDLEMVSAIDVSVVDQPQNTILSLITKEGATGIISSLVVKDNSVITLTAAHVAAAANEEEIKFHKLNPMVYTSNKLVRNSKHVGNTGDRCYIVTHCSKKGKTIMVSTYISKAVKIKLNKKEIALQCAVLILIPHLENVIWSGSLVMVQSSVYIVSSMITIRQNGTEKCVLVAFLANDMLRRTKIINKLE